MIQQPQYTPTTSKYNFPPLTPEDTVIVIPPRFLELSIRTIKNIQKSTMLYPPQTQTEKPFTSPEENIPFLQGEATPKLTIIPIQPHPDHTPIIAIDVSSIKIGETRTGILLALRAATVWKQKSSSYRYLRFGPFPFHITDQNKHEISTLFNQHIHQHETLNLHNFTSTLNLQQMQTRMTTLLEKWLQTQIAQQTHNSIILLDGSLTAGIGDTPLTSVSQLLDTARKHNNIIVAITKITHLRLNNHSLTDLTQNTKQSCLLKIENFPSEASSHIRYLGNIHVAKLSTAPYSFRLDTDKIIPTQQAVKSIEHLIGNDIITNGYPETLRLAHIYSTFTANEVIGIQRFLAQTYRIKIVQRPNIRQILFGPYAKGPPEES